MPFFKTAGKLVYYAHVPKCGGTSIARYIRNRFGPLAFNDNDYLDQPVSRRWTRSSPQHVDVATLEQLIPLPMFDTIFTVVRHPVPRLVSIYHFQLEMERSIAPDTGFSDWLAALDPDPADAPFAYDNHIRPMAALVPDGATVFHMEHGLDGLVGWFDLVAGNSDGARAILPQNERGAHVAVKAAKVTPSAADLDRIAGLYAVDFARFGYDPGLPAPRAAPPVLSEAFLADRSRDLVALQTPLARLGRKLRRQWRQIGKS